MSDAVQQEPMRQRLHGRWQIPLLAAALLLLGVGLWSLRPTREQPRFTDALARAMALIDAELYPEASDYISAQLAAPTLTAGQRRQFNRLMARVIYAHEKENAVHGEANARRIIEHSDAGMADGLGADAETALMRAHAFEWQALYADAVASYRRALSAGAQHPWRIRKRILEIQNQAQLVEPEVLLAEYDTFLDADGVDPSLRYWAAEQKVAALSSQGRHAEAEQFLARHADRFDEPGLQNPYQFLQALSWYYLGRLDDAERLLRSLRSRLVPGDALYAGTGWLLGKVIQSYEAPQPALSFYNDVLEKTTPNPYTGPCILGRAETLAALQQYDDSLEAFEKVIRLASRGELGTSVDLQVVRQSTTAWYEKLRQEGRPAEAMSYLRIAARLAPPTDSRLQIVYEERLADLAAALGERELAQAGDATTEEPGDSGRQWFVEAADHYLKLAKLTALEDEVSSEAIWNAADALDQAGERRRRAKVLDAFVKGRPNNTRVPEALLRLGQTYQAMGEHARAVEVYQQNLIDHPRTFWANQSIVPLVECFIDLGENEKAEQTLLRVVDRSPGDDLALITPEAAEYRNALFLLGDLYADMGNYENAIARYEEAIDRYPDDPRTGRAVFQLACAYRGSADRIRRDIKDPKHLPFKDELKVLYYRRLVNAERLFGRLIERYQDRPESSLGDLEKLYIKLSHFYRADAIYDRSYVLDPADQRPYIEALPKYDKAAWLYQHDPIAMSAYVQIVNCHLRMGNVYEARKALQRAGWALRNIPPKNFEGLLPADGREFWEEYLTWLQQTPMFAPADDREDS